MKKGKKRKEKGVKKRKGKEEKPNEKGVKEKER